ncbi:MAG: hypothetical protein NTV89_03960, partial [Proteobacteria bacterium]|nr:hypothetical protein [Pseudomonadota bacterium]
MAYHFPRQTDVAASYPVHNAVKIKGLTIFMWFALFYFLTTSHVSLLLKGEDVKNYTHHSALLLLITFMFLLLFLPVVSLAADGVIQLPKTGQTKCYDTSGAEISCA